LDEDLLDEIGKRSGGDSDQVQSPDEIVPLFTQTVERSQKAVVRNAQMTLRLVSGVVPRQVWQVTPSIVNLGYKPLGEHDVQVQLDQLDAEQGKALVIELLIPPRNAGRYRIAQIEMGYDLPMQNVTGASVRRDIVLDYTADAQAAKAYDATMMNLIERLTAYKLQRAPSTTPRWERGRSDAKAARRRHASAGIGRDRSGRGRAARGE
jgi:Ca-activated chloride channel family protein